MAVLFLSLSFSLTLMISLDFLLPAFNKFTSALVARIFTRLFTSMVLINSILMNFISRDTGETSALQSRSLSTFKTFETKSTRFKRCCACVLVASFSRNCSSKVVLAA